MSLAPTTSQAQLVQRYKTIRAFSDRIAAPLSPEDCMIQSMEDASPVRWHLAHTSWFFETFLLKACDDYQPLNEKYEYLFNSYYNAIGKQFPRPHRGVISRPGLADVLEYRAYVDQEMVKRIESGEISGDLLDVLEVGLHHEQQHQELILTDFKHALSCNPLLPSYENSQFDQVSKGHNSKDDWIDIPAGNYHVGHDAHGFCFDNELPAHTVYLNDFSIGNSLVTCGQYIEFIEDGGYQRPEHWLSLGWTQVQAQEWDAPLYWVNQEGKWKVFTLAGLVEVNPDWPLCHVSYFEADAYARWSGHRLPTEFEWEVAFRKAKIENGENGFADKLLDADLAIHPTRHSDGFLGNVWQWTSSSYQAYPGYAAPPGAIGEYNGKFMCNQYVLRGGSVATSSTHIRDTYRNFFPPSMRWQFCGLRLAR